MGHQNFNCSYSPAQVYIRKTVTEVSAACMCKDNVIQKEETDLHVVSTSMKYDKYVFVISNFVISNFVISKT